MERIYIENKDTGEETVVRLRKWMSTNGISQAELSRRSGISQSRLSLVLRGKYEYLTQEFFLRLKKCPGLPLRWIMYGI